MKNTEYKVSFTTGKQTTVYAAGPLPAMILAQAEQIKEGNNFEVCTVLNLETNELFATIIPASMFVI